MKKIFNTLTALFFLFSVYSGKGHANDWDKIEKIAKNIKSVSARFTQEKHMKILARPLISKGKLFFTSPDSLRWEYISPLRSILITRNGIVKSYVKGSNGLVEDSRSKAEATRIVTREIISWLNGRFHDNPNFKTSLCAGQIAKIILTPKEKSISNIINKIELRVSRKKGIIKSVKIFENKNSYTLLRFSDVKHNKKIDETFYMEIE